MKKIIFLSIILLFNVPVWGQSASRNDCFPFEKLSADQRKKAEQMLLKALDGEALYTIAGGLKPMSSGFQSFQLQVGLPRLSVEEAEKTIKELGAKKAEELSKEETPRLNRAKQTIERRQTIEKINETKAIFEKWRCGDDFFADVQHFAQVFEGKRFYDTIVFSRPRLREMISEKIDFFSRIGITPNSHPLEVLYAVEYNQTSQRFAGYGYLFGYPDYAVKFFVDADNEEKFTGKFVERDFISLPTISGDNHFVYVVEKGHVQNEADKILKAKAEKIFDEYKRRRTAYIGEGKKGVVELVRDWFCNSQNQCSTTSVKFN